MKIKRIDYEFSICKVKDYSCLDLSDEFCFIGKTDEENSLVCLKEKVPKNVIKQDDGWKVLRIDEVLDFSLIGILANIADILAKNNIGIFVISTYNTDYVLTKSENYEKAINALAHAGYQIENNN